MKLLYTILALLLSFPIHGTGVGSHALPGEGGARDQEQAASSKTVFAFRTNALVPLMNVGLELPIGNVVSLEADGYFPWVKPEFCGHLACAQALHADAGIRFWFNTRRQGDRLLGHSLALKAGATKFDLGWNKGVGTGEYHMAGRQGASTEATLDYMYAFRLGSALRMEVGAGFGAVYHRDFSYDQYEKGGPLLRDARLIETRGWFFGPAMVHVNIVLPIKVKE